MEVREAGRGKRASECLVRSVPPQMHMVHVNTKYQYMAEAQCHPDGLAVLAVLLEVREGLCDSKKGVQFP
jgi:hypothetical protein